jgi:hypothetical protein
VLDSVESWNWAVRISVVGLFVLALAGIAYSMSSVVVPVLLAWMVAMLRVFFDRSVAITTRAR